MKQKKMKRTLYYCMLLSSLGITTACVDNSYDLTKDIDMTITVGGDLTTPGSYSEDIKLSDLLDIDSENSDLKEEKNGDYVLKFEGDATNSTIRVNDVVIDAIPSQETASDEIKFDLTGLRNNLQEITAPIKGLNPSVELNNTEIPKDVVALEYATVNGIGRFTLNLNIAGNINKVTLKQGLKFVFPEYVKLKAAGDFTKEGNQMVLNHDVELKKNTGVQWYFDVEKIYFESVDGVNIPDGQGFVEPKGNSPAKVYFNLQVPIEGNVAVKKADFPVGESEVRFNVLGIVSSQEMKMGNVRAMVDPVIDDFSVSDVTIEDLPDFLTDNDVKADLHNPQIYLNINNETPVEVNFKANLIALKENLPVCNTIVLGTDRETYIEGTSIRLKPSHNIICLCPHPEEIQSGSNDTTFIKVPELPNLIKTIPDRIKVEVDDHSVQVIQNTYEVQLGKDYNVTTDYRINAPLEFGDEFNIVYNDTIDNWNKDIKDYEMKEVEVTLNAENAIPLNLHLEAKAIDVNGNEMQDIEVVVVEPGMIAAGSLTDKKTSALTVILRNKDGVSRIKNLDGLIFTLRGDVDPENSERILNANQTLKLKDLRLRIRGGVTMDLN